MGGYELLERAREYDPPLPFLFSSGDTDQSFRDKLDSEEGVTFIAKPFTMVNLSRAVRRALGREEGN